MDKGEMIIKTLTDGDDVMNNIKWCLYAVSWGAIDYLTWGLPIGSYLMIQLAVLGVFVSGAINGND